MYTSQIQIKKKFLFFDLDNVIAFISFEMDRS